MAELVYKGIGVDVLEFNEEESKQHVAHDFNVLVRNNIDSLIKEQFIPWLKGEEYTDRDDDKIFKGLRVYEIVYDYGRIIADYSPTGQEDFFGHFEFDIESCDDYTADMLEAVAMEVYVLGDAIVKVSGYDI